MGIIGRMDREAKRLQSSPDPGAGRSTPPSPARSARSATFQSSPSRRAGRSRSRSARPAAGRPCFNPRPARGSGAAYFVAVFLARSPRFQSSPSPRAGRSVKENAPTSEPITVFQSSPSPRAGRSHGTPPSTMERSGRFHSRPTRGLGTVEPRRSAPNGCNRFNPRPTRRPGAAWDGADGLVRQGMFQSSPGPRAGRSHGTPPSTMERSGRFHSRPTRGLGAVEPRRSAPNGCNRFNPRPTRRPGAAWDGADGLVRQGMFQSSPSPRAGRRKEVVMASATNDNGFNPRPTREPGATLIPRASSGSPPACPRPRHRPGARRRSPRTIVEPPTRSVASR